MGAKLEGLLLQYAGDNVGAGCECLTCDDNRQPLREYFESMESLLREAIVGLRGAGYHNTADELEAKLKDLDNE